MNRRSTPFLFTSESVTEGHPDKVADQISDAVLDAHLAGDPEARVACEVMVSRHRVTVAGETRSEASVDVHAMVRSTLAGIGYDRPELGFWHEGVAVEVDLHRQSGEIAQGVDVGGAGDQGLMFGFACSETAGLMPLPIMLAHRVTRRLAEVRRSGELEWLRPDGKAQVTVEYRRGEPARLHTVVVSCQHEASVRQTEIEAAVREVVLPAALGEWSLDGSSRLLVNPTGSFVVGGPVADVGLTGRKIIVDTYGGSAPHGGGAFSGKDASKVDRSASYMARYVAKAVVRSGAATTALVQLAYAIGEREPVSVLVDTAGTGRVADGEIEATVRTVFDLDPASIISVLDLRRPQFRKTASYGHFGREAEGFRWEAVAEAADRLSRALR